MFKQRFNYSPFKFLKSAQDFIFSSQEVNSLHSATKNYCNKVPPNNLGGSTQNGICRPVLDYNHFLNNLTKRREISIIRELSKLFSQKDKETISLAGGLPSPDTFPFKEISIQLTHGGSISLNEEILQNALQYIPTQGYPPLLEKLEEIQKKIHQPPCWENLKILITPGCQDGLSKSIDMSMEEGEPIIVQHPVYSGAECLVKPYTSDIIPINQDENGMLPESLEKNLEKRWTSKETFTLNRGIPKLLYVNTTGANPTGVALTKERMKEIYRLACKYNLIILEDDPYYYLNFKNTYPESFLSIDTEGRVLRFDSFSKIISPGLRVGFVTGPKPLVDKIELQVQSSSLHASSLSQVIIDKVIETWGYDGLFKHFETTQNYYKSKRDVMIAAAKKYLTGLAEWNEPTAGMFLWIKVLGVPDVYNLVTNECVKKKVLFVIGHAYFINKKDQCSYLRACFSLATEEEIEEGIKRLAEAIQIELAKNSTDNGSLSKPLNYTNE